MKKTLWIPLVIVVLIAAWLGASWYSGARVEAELTSGVGAINKAWANPGMDLQLKRLSYERGLLSTHARYALVIGELPQDQAPEIDMTIWHGPFAHSLAPRKYALYAKLVPAGAVKKMADALMNGNPPLVIDMGCGYGGHCSGTGHIAAIDFSAQQPKVQVTFGGVKMQFDVDYRSETDYQVDSSAQLLPLKINDQDFGSGQITAAGNARSVNETLSWKTGEGESKVALALAMARVVTNAEMAAVKPEEMLDFIGKLITSVTVNVSLSKPMLIGTGARAVHVIQGTDVETARKQVSAQFDALLTSQPKVQEYLRAEGDTLTSDWRYADGKLSINGKDSAGTLELFKNAARQARMAP